MAREERGIGFWPVGVMICAIAACGIGVSSSAAAQTSTPTAQAQTVHSYNASKALMRRRDGPLDADDAALLKRAILIDANVDDAEQIIIDALLNDESFVVKPPKFGSEVTFTRVASPEAKAILREISSVKIDDPLLAAWRLATSESVASVLARYQGSDDGKREVTEMLASRAAELNKDGYKDDWKALRGAMLTWSSACRKLEGDDWSACRRMAFEGILHADKDGRSSTVGNIPDQIYAPLNPDQSS